MILAFVKNHINKIIKKYNTSHASKYDYQDSPMAWIKVNQLQK